VQDIEKLCGGIGRLIILIFLEQEQLADINNMRIINK
jgi:hypothetical protein